MKKTLGILGAGILAVAIVLGLLEYRSRAPRHTPSGQPPLLHVGEGGPGPGPVLERFNAAAGRTRILALLSPT